MKLATRRKLQIASSVKPLPLQDLSLQPLVSVLISNFNYERYIRSAVQSVVAQTYDNIEVVLCDDGSTDGSLHALKQFREHSQVRILHQRNLGQAAALNRAYEASSGEIICLLDSDDEFVTDKVSTVVEAMTSSNHGFLVHALEVIDASGHPTGARMRPDPQEQGWILPQVVNRGGRWRSAPTSALCMRREVATRIFPIPEKPFRTEADAFIYTLAPMLTTVLVSDQSLARYRGHGANNTAWAASLNPTSISRSLDAMRRINETVNARAVALGLPTVRLSDNSLYVEHSYLALALAGHSRPKLVGVWTRVTATLLRQDFFSTTKAAILALVYLSIVPVPLSFRSRVLNLCFRAVAATKR